MPSKTEPIFLITGIIGTNQKPLAKSYTKNFLKAEKLDGLLEKVIDFVIKT